MNKPKVNFNNLPYSNSYTDIDRDNTIIQIGNSDYYEDVFSNTNENLYIETICELIPHYSFNNNIQVSMNYRNEFNDNVQRIAKYNLYDNSIISMEHVVSSIDIVLLDILNNSKTIMNSGTMINVNTNNFNKNSNNITTECNNNSNDIDNNFVKNNVNTYTINNNLNTNICRNNNIIYTKIFGKQNKNICLETIENDTEYGINTISNAYLFGGSFKPNNIQQYLFYIEHNYNEKTYISLISSEDIIINNNKNIQVSKHINKEQLSTLQDDIMNGKIIIDINNKQYQSILYNKNTLMSNKVNIIFKQNK